MKQAAHGVFPKAPVLLVHGIAANARMWQSPFQEGHLASFLSHFGYPVYAVDLRNRSGKPGKDWDLDDYVLFDLPAALKAIADDSGCSAVHWIGHSMGGLLGYMYQALHGSDKVLSLITLGSPGFKLPASHGHTVRLVKNLLTMTSLGVSTGRLDLLPRQIMTQLIQLSFLSGSPHRADDDEAIMEEFGAKQLLGNISLGEARQITSIARRRGLFSPRYHFLYQNFVDRIEAPLLAIAGNRDFIVPAPLVKKAFQDVGAKRKAFLELRGQHAYGHLDLLMSRYARHDVWEKILEWLRDCAKPNRALVPVESATV